MSITNKINATMKVIAVTGMVVSLIAIVVAFLSGVMGLSWAASAKQFIDHYIVFIAAPVLISIAIVNFGMIQNAKSKANALWLLSVSIGCVLVTIRLVYVFFTQ